MIYSNVIEDSYDCLKSSISSIIGKKEKLRFLKALFPSQAINFVPKLSQGILGLSNGVVWTNTDSVPFLSLRYNDLRSI